MGIMCSHVIGPDNRLQPRHRRYIQKCNNYKDERNPIRILGYLKQLALDKQNWEVADARDWFCHAARDIELEESKISFKEESLAKLPI